MIKENKEKIEALDSKIDKISEAVYRIEGKLNNGLNTRIGTNTDAIKSLKHDIKLLFGIAIALGGLYILSMGPKAIDTLIYIFKIVTAHLFI